MHVVGLWEGTGEKQEASCSEPALMQASMATYLVLGTSEYCFSFFLNMISQEGGFGCLQHGVLEHAIRLNVCLHRCCH